MFKKHRNLALFQTKTFSSFLSVFLNMFFWPLYKGNCLINGSKMGFQKCVSKNVSVYGIYRINGPKINLSKKLQKSDQILRSDFEIEVSILRSQNVPDMAFWNSEVQNLTKMSRKHPHMSMFLKTWNLSFKSDIFRFICC